MKFNFIYNFTVLHLKYETIFFVFPFCALCTNNTCYNHFTVLQHDFFDDAVDVCGCY